MEPLNQESVTEGRKDINASLEPAIKRTYSVFRFIGEALAFDLVNTEITTMKGKYLDLLGDPADLERWWREVLPYHPEISSNFEHLELPDFAVDEQLLERIKRLRREIRTLFSDLIDQRPIEAEGLNELNKVLKSSYQQLIPFSNDTVRPVYRVGGDQKEIILLAVALSAIKLLTQSKPGRLRKCKNERCIGMFYDNTKSATRYWCHVNCKDRARAAERYQLTKA